jgi:hypothetical protein
VSNQKKYAFAFKNICVVERNKQETDYHFKVNNKKKLGNNKEIKEW